MLSWAQASRASPVVKTDSSLTSPSQHPHLKCPADLPAHQQPWHLSVHSPSSSTATTLGPLHLSICFTLKNYVVAQYLNSITHATHLCFPISVSESSTLINTPRGTGTVVCHVKLPLVMSTSGTSAGSSPSCFASYTTSMHMTCHLCSRPRWSSRFQISAWSSPATTDTWKMNQQMKNSFSLSLPFSL